MKKITLSFLFLLPLLAIAQCYFSKFDCNHLYIVVRGTKTKQRFIAHNFNLIDSNITHVGIGLLDKKDKKFKIYNIIPTNSGAAFTIDSVKSFLSPGDIYYYGIWKIRLSKSKQKISQEVIEKYRTKKVLFDYDFQIKDDNLLYCSEFVWLVLSQIDKKVFAFKPISKELDADSIGRILKRDTLVYIPLDFFLFNKRFKKIVGDKIITN